MSDSSRRLRANKVIAGQPCAACAAPLAFGAETAVCTACEAVHCAACWDGKGGCAREGCANAPLRQIEPPPIPAGGAAKARARPGTRVCPHCGFVSSAAFPVCTKCRRSPDPSGVAAGPPRNAPGAVAALVWGIASLVLCALCGVGVIAGFVAISQANQAQRAIEMSPVYAGAGMAQAGKVLGVLGIVLSAVTLLVALANR